VHRQLPGIAVQFITRFQDSTVANIKSAKKRAKQTVVRNQRNTSQRSMPAPP